MSQRVSIFLVVLLLMFNGEILGQPKSSFSIPFSGRVTIKKTPISLNQHSAYLKYLSMKIVPGSINIVY